MRAPETPPVDSGGVFFWHDSFMSERAARIPSISCVMPAYNEAAALPEVLAQVLAALRALSPRVEVVVVDDGSRDDTVAVVRGLCQREPACAWCSCRATSARRRRSPPAWPPRAARWWC
jgi:cellulose synthase/poly-beta-1,6-N-acetylglucosamine synthase-like glycosyltransferase